MNRLLTFFAFFAIALVSANAAPPSTAASARNVVIEVTVPEDVPPVTYYVDGQLITVASGTTAELPPKATQITLHEGVILRVKRIGGPAALRLVEYRLTETITLAQYNEASFQANIDAFQFIGNPVGPIKHPNQQERYLMRAVRLSALGYGNPANVLSDGN